ncbi:hypothetical protein Tco_0471389 [Tanacetum coccineum]
MAQAAGIQSLFNEFLATPIDFSAFIMYQLKINNLTQEVLTGLTYDLIKGTCKSVVKLEYHLEEVFKATNDRLDWNNPERKPYPHDLSKPLPLILNEQVKWIEDKVSKIWSLVKVVYDKHAYWGTYHWGPKPHKFYGYASNMETLKDVYSRNRIIAVTNLKIMKWFGYNHLEEIIIRRQDDQLYKFREGDFKRLCRQDIEDMLLLLVQDKLTNLNLEERQRAHVMINAIDKKLKDRRLMRSLEKFVGGRPYGGDLRVLEMTI